MRWWLILIPLAHANKLAENIINAPETSESITLQQANNQCYPSRNYLPNSYYCDGLLYATSSRGLIQRCDDNRGYSTQKGCEFVNSKTGQLFVTSTTTPYTYIYTQKVPCLSTICDPGTTLGGCMRYNPGTCSPCTGQLQSGYYWSTRGQCDQALCQPIPPGFYYSSPCGSTVNAILSPCAKYKNNHLGPVPSSSRATAKYFCPGGLSEPLPVPNNAHVTDDSYTSFTCDDGYFQQKSDNNPIDSCAQCKPGSYCLGGISIKCPRYYYQSRDGQTACNICKRQCSDFPCTKNIADLYAQGNNGCGLVPEICDEGSTKDAGCITCGMCGTWPETGRNCILGDEMDALPPTHPYP